MDQHHIPNPFQIYTASAGSGKTFLLVQKYLESLLGSQSPRAFHRRLALTFTNKAVFEMKFRILAQLNAFARQGEDFQKNEMAKTIMITLGISKQELAQRSQRLLNAILHDYAAFDVITLDSFTHRVIRSFSRDLGLSYNFNVELQVDLMLQQIVDELLELVGQEKEITEILEQFTFAKMDGEGNSWDIKENLLVSAKLLLSENDRHEIKAIARLSEEKKVAQQKYLFTQHKKCSETLIRIGKEAIALCQRNELEQSDFSYGTLYKRFLKLSKGDFDAFDSGTFYQKLQEGKGIYPSKIEEHKKKRIVSLLPQFLDFFTEARTNYYTLMLLQDITKQWVPLRLLARLAKQLEEHQKAENKILLSTFNERIAEEILKHPSAFIYERLGENYRHYFLDEFQDTSTLQWQNLIPLIENALVSQDNDGHVGQLLLVGDPKQSIYRWRGGDVDQFIGLLSDNNPFQIEKEIQTLKTNYRSADQIIGFNNSLYSSLTRYLKYSENKTIFGSSTQQEVTGLAGGYVQIDLLEKKKSEETLTQHSAQVITHVNQCYSRGIPYHDIAVLVRKRKQAVEVARAMTGKIPFVSSESLLLSKSNEINFLLTLIYMYVHPEDKRYKKEHLAYLFSVKHRSEDQHDYLVANLKKPICQIWHDEEIDFNLNLFERNTLYGVMEMACFVFPGLKSTEIFIQSFLNLVFEYGQKEGSNAVLFLDYWEKEGQHKTLAMPDTADGVRIMTIHQAKGLQFPTVIFPYANEPIHPKHKPNVWLDTTEHFGDHFPLAWINFSKNLENYGQEGKRCYEKLRREQEIDAWNIFYVATTRAVDNLFIISTDEETSQDSYASFLAFYLAQENKNLEHKSFTWGKLPPEGQMNVEKAPVESPVNPLKRFRYEEKLHGKAMLSDDLQDAIHYGILIHDLLSRISYAEELDHILEIAYQRGEITQNQKQRFTILFKKIVGHTTLEQYYNRPYKVLNEQTILLESKELVRPDRIVYQDDQVVVLDYKTGEINPKDKIQLSTYCQLMRDIFNRPTLGYLIYLPKNEDRAVETIEVSLNG